MSKDVEKALSSLHALLGESPEASAAVAALRDLAEEAQCAPTGDERDVAFCLDRIALAVEKRIESERLASYEKGRRDADEGEWECEACGHPVLIGNGDDEHDDMDGDAASALASVYGEND